MKGEQMKFLQEMIAKKRASQHGLEDEDFADQEDMDAAMASGDGDFRMEDTDSFDAQDDFVAGADDDYEDDYDDDADDDGDLFEDQSYDWEFDGAETADLSKEPAEDASLHAPEDNDYDDDDDIDAGVANVLREVAGKTQAQSMPEPGEPAVASRLEENVEKLRIQRKIWDLESDTNETEAASQPVDEDTLSFDAAADADADADADDDFFDDEHEDVAEDGAYEEDLEDLEADQEDLEAYAAEDDETVGLDDENEETEAAFEDEMADEASYDDEPDLSAAAAMAGLRSQNPRVQSKNQLRREPAPRREQAQMPRMAAPDAEEQAQGGAPKPRAGRVKTRLLGFHRPEDKPADPFAKAAEARAEDAPAPEMEAPAGDPQFPVGWLIVLEGPGRGASFTLTGGVSKIGRGQDQAVRLDFGDTSISRDNHAAIAYDEERRTFFIGHGGKANLVRLNDMPVLSTETITHDDQIRIGETTLRFIALCGPDFSWDTEGEADSSHEAAE